MLTLQEKAIYAICNAAELFAREDLMAAMEESRRDPIDLPDPDEVVEVARSREPRTVHA